MCNQLFHYHDHKICTHILYVNLSIQNTYTSTQTCTDDDASCFTNGHLMERVPKHAEISALILDHLKLTFEIDESSGTRGVQSWNTGMEWYCERRGRCDHRGLLLLFFSSLNTKLHTQLIVELHLLTLLTPAFRSLVSLGLVIYYYSSNTMCGFGESQRSLLFCYN